MQPQDEAGRRRRVRRMTIGLFTLAIVVYAGFILLRLKAG
jgi:hypothetical protein